LKNKNKWLIGLIPISVLIILFAKNNSSCAEYYAVNIYPIFVKAWGLFSFITNESLAEIIIIAFLLITILLTAVVIVKTVKNRTSAHIKKYILGLISFFSVMYFLFVLFCGINYYRYEFTHYSGLEIQESSKQELIELCETLIEDANEYRSKLSTDDSGTAELLDKNFHETAQRAKNAMSRVSEEYKILEGNFSAPKAVRQSKVMSYLGITGIFFPYTFEANVNVHIPPYQIPSVMLHELVHLRGFMREDEANFIAYLACIKSGYDDFYYSGTMTALSYSMNALYSADYDEFVKLYNLYSEDVRKDTEFSRNYWKQFDTKVADMAHKVNDTYLKANNQYDGVRSYGRMVDLLLAYYRQL
jgi:hypothetical protein